MDTAEIAQKLSATPGALIRTVLRPVSDERATEVRTEAYATDQRLQGTLDANSSVVDIRCFISHTDKVSVGLKRVVTAMATDSVLSKLSPNEMEQVWKDPLGSVTGFSRLCITAAAFIRLPALEYALVKEAKSTLTQIETAAKARQKLKDDIEQDIMRRIEDMIDHNNQHVLEIFRDNMRGIIEDSLEESKSPAPGILDAAHLNSNYSASQELN